MTRILRRAVSSIALLLAMSAPLHAACPGDCDGSGTVSFDDLVCAIFEFGTANTAADCDGSGEIEFADLICILFGFGQCLGLEPMVMDGSFDDWANITPVATDVLGDASGAFDLTSVSVVTRGETLFVRFDTNIIRNLQAGSQLDGTLVFQVTGPKGDTFIGDMRNREFSDGTGGPFGGIGHAEAGFHTLPTYASDEYELTMDLSFINATMGDTISIEFSGSDSLDAPIVHTLIDDPDPAIEQSIDRLGMPALRIANLNVLSRGLTDPQRGAPIHRLIRGINADIYCFQEQWNGSIAEVRNAMALAFADVPGLPDARSIPNNWNVVIENGAVLATVLPLEPISVPGTREASGIVTLADGSRVLMVSVHLKCCGSIGSSEDIRRINATTAYAAFIEGMLDADPNLGVVVVGDWNLVGSRTPLDIMTEETLGLRRLPLLQVAARRAFTWRDAGSSFVPGMLDLLVYSEDTLTMGRGFVLDTAQLSQGTLGANGFLSTDSEVSDHLMLVADFFTSPS